MNVNLEYYKVFYHVAKLGSVTQAAEELYISQPAVSQSLKQLEAALGGSLFFRTTKGVKLTPEGELLFSYISQGIDIIKLGESKFSELLNLDTGEVRIGASDMTLQFYLLSYLEEFHRLYPKIKVKVTNAPTPETIASLNKGKIDFGIVSEPIVERQGLSVSPVFEIQDVFIAGEHYKHLKDKVILLKELETLPLICLEKNTSTRLNVDTFLQENGVTLNPEFELATSDLIVHFALRNLGIGCVVQKFAEEYYKNDSLFELKLEKPIPPRRFCVITADKTPISPAGKRLLSILDL